MLRYIVLALAITTVGACKERVANTASVADQTPAPALAPRDDVSYRQLGVNPDCSEQPFTYENLMALVRAIPARAGADKQQEFLNRLPRNVMQTFTISYKSESAQLEGIDRVYPGIIRMSQDGKLVMRYTCNRDVKSVYGTVEVIHFDNADASFKFTQIDLNQKLKKNIVTENPGVCLGCHNVDPNTDDPRPNWNMYPDWPGMFGSHDDFFPAGTEAEASLVHHAAGWTPPNKSEELHWFQEFMRAKVLPNAETGQAGDPCYTTLPWPQPIVSGGPLPTAYALYPFDVKNGHAGDRQYALRPNLKFTEIFSKLLSRRNFRKLKEHPKYQSVRVALALEAASCGETDIEFQEQPQTSPPPPVPNATIDSLLLTALPNYKRPLAASAKTVMLRGEALEHHDPRHPSARAQALFGVWTALGYAGGDWSLTPFEYNEPQYETGGGAGANQEFPGDLPLTAYVQTQILEDVVGLRPDLFTRATGETDDLGEQFACIDALAAPKVLASNDARKKLCAELSTMAEARSKGGDTTRGLDEHPRATHRPHPEQYQRGQDLKKYIKSLDGYGP